MRESRAASLMPQTGWWLNRKSLLKLDHHPVRSINGSFAIFFLMSRPPLLARRGDGSPNSVMLRRKGFVFSIRIFLLLLIVQLGPHRLLARQTVNYATVSGRVADPTDAVVPGAEIVARQTNTNLISSATTDQDGRFRFPYLRPGPYELSVRVPGFTTITRSVTLTIGMVLDLPISLTVAAVQTDVNVTGDHAVLETTRTQISGTVLQTEVKNLPVNGRNFLDIALLVPGRIPDEYRK